MARFRIGPVRVGGGRRVSVTGGLGPFGITVGGRRKKRRGNFDRSDGVPTDGQEMSEEQLRIQFRNHQIAAYQSRELVFIFAHSRQLNRMTGLLGATFGWVNLPRDLRVWSPVVGVVILAMLSLSRIVAKSYLKNKVKNLSALDETGHKAWDDPDSWYEEFPLSQNRQTVNNLSLGFLTANLAWAFATEPKPEYPGIGAGAILCAWILARVVISSGNSAVPLARFFIKSMRLLAVYVLWCFAIGLIGWAFNVGIILGLGALVLSPIVAVRATSSFWKITKLGSRVNTTEISRGSNAINDLPISENSSINQSIDQINAIKATLTSGVSSTNQFIDLINSMRTALRTILKSIK